MAAVLAACSPSIGPEAGVRQWLADARTAVEARDRAALMDLISTSYTDARGNNRDDIDRTMRLVFFRNRSIVLASKIDQLSVIGDSAANVSLTVGMAGTDAGLLGFSADAWRFELELEQGNDGWQLIGARWGELGEEMR